MAFLDPTLAGQILTRRQVGVIYMQCCGRALKLSLNSPYSLRACDPAAKQEIIEVLQVSLSKPVRRQLMSHDCGRVRWDQNTSQSGWRACASHSSSQLDSYRPSAVASVRTLPGSFAPGLLPSLLMLAAMKSRVSVPGHWAVTGPSDRQAT